MTQKPFHIDEISRQKMEKRNWPSLVPRFSLLGGIGLAVLFFFVIDLVLGSVRIPFSEVINILLGTGSENKAWESIVLKIRLPKAITAILAGAALSVGGLQMQTLFRNPLAGPSVLGITSGASLGVAAVMLTSGNAATLYAIKEMGITGSWLIVGASILGSATILLLILGISFKVKDNVVLLIVGLMLANITISIVSIWQYFSNPDLIRDYIMWTFGSLGGVTSNQALVLAIVVLIGLIMAFLVSKPLNALLLGENYASSMGMNVNFTRIFIIAGTSILAGAVTGFCGPIGFVGIAVPHLARAILNTSDHKFLIPCTCLAGAVVLLICDIIAQMPGSNMTLPINAITALIGSPVVIWVILKSRNLRNSF